MTDKSENNVNTVEEELRRFGETFEAIKDVPWAAKEYIAIHKRLNDGLKQLLEEENKLESCDKTEEEILEEKAALDKKYKDIESEAMQDEIDLLKRVIHEHEQMRAQMEEEKKALTEEYKDLLRDVTRRTREAEKLPAKVYPNDPCPCGSGKKYKKCCGKMV